MREQKLVDSNIIVYAFDISEGEKHEIAKKEFRQLIESGNAFFSVQNLSEFYNIATRHIAKPITHEKAQKIIANINKIEDAEVANISSENLQDALEMKKDSGSDFWDCLIAAVMQENNVEKICTENVSDFEPIEGVEPENPFT